MKQAERFLGITQAYPENSTVMASVMRGDEQLELELFLEPIDVGTTGIQFSLPNNNKKRREFFDTIQANPAAEVPFRCQKLARKSSAAIAGLKRGDQILSLDGVDTPNLTTYQRQRASLVAADRWYAGDRIAVTYRKKMMHPVRFIPPN